jgi:hypothetical protein
MNMRNRMPLPRKPGNHAFDSVKGVGKYDPLLGGRENIDKFGLGAGSAPLPRFPNEDEYETGSRTDYLNPETEIGPQVAGMNTDQLIESEAAREILRRRLQESGPYRANSREDMYNRLKNMQEDRLGRASSRAASGMGTIGGVSAPSQLEPSRLEQYLPRSESEPREGPIKNLMTLSAMRQKEQLAGLANQNKLEIQGLKNEKKGAGRDRYVDPTVQSIREGQLAKIKEDARRRAEEEGRLKDYGHYSPKEVHRQVEKAEKEYRDEKSQAAMSAINRFEEALGSTLEEISISGTSLSRGGEPFDFEGSFFPSALGVGGGYFAPPKTPTREGIQYGQSKKLSLAIQEISNIQLNKLSGQASSEKEYARIAGVISKVGNKHELIRNIQRMKRILQERNNRIFRQIKHGPTRDKTIAEWKNTSPGHFLSVPLTTKKDFTEKKTINKASPRPKEILEKSTGGNATVGSILEKDLPNVFYFQTPDGKKRKTTKAKFLALPPARRNKINKFPMYKD